MEVNEEIYIKGNQETFVNSTGETVEILDIDTVECP